MQFSLWRGGAVTAPHRLRPRSRNKARSVGCMRLEAQIVQGTTSRRRLKSNACALSTSVKGPDFICIGMPKAGTGWLYDQLSHHPDFWMPPGKELHYLNQDRTRAKIFKRYLEDWDRTVRYGRRLGLTWGERELTFVREIVSHAGKPMDIDRCASLFRHKGRLLSGDISPGYGTIEDEGIRKIAAGLPETKIILLVREPVSRAWSRLCMVERDGRFDVSLLDDPAKFAKFIRRSRHTSAFFATKIIRQWSRRYPSDTQFRVILFDDIVQRPEETLREILSFVGADPSKAGTLPADFNRKSRLRKLDMPDAIGKVLAEYLEGEVRFYSALLGGATRDAWPS